MDVRYMLWQRGGLILKLAKDGTVIARTYDNGRWGGINGQWRIMGLRQRGPFNRPGPLIPLVDAARIREFSYANGTPRYYIEDLDHGTIRLQVSPGLRDLRAV